MSDVIAIKEVVRDIKHSAKVDDHSADMVDFMYSLASRLESTLTLHERGLSEEVLDLKAFIDRFVNTAENVTQFKPAMSYSDSYFGESPGIFKQKVSELEHTITAYDAYLRGDYRPAKKSVGGEAK